MIIAPLLLLSSCVNDAFLGVTKAGWLDIGKAAASGALKGAAASALPAYSEARQTSAKAANSPFKP